MSDDPLDVLKQASRELAQKREKEASKTTDLPTTTTGPTFSFPENLSPNVTITTTGVNVTGVVVQSKDESVDGVTRIHDKVYCPNCESWTWKEDITEGPFVTIPGEDDQFYDSGDGVYLIHQNEVAKMQLHHGWYCHDCSEFIKGTDHPEEAEVWCCDECDTEYDNIDDAKVCYDAH